jgi:hypothetical protein
MGNISFKRQLRYLYLRLIRLREHPHELALGMALGIFIGIMPIIPFHMISAVALAMFFKASKITAAAGTWICNPVTIYPIYRYCYKIGSFLLGFKYNARLLGTLIEEITQGAFLNAITAILSAGGKAVAAFLTGGVVLGGVFAVPSYFLFLHFFKAFAAWHTARKGTKV